MWKLYTEKGIKAWSHYMLIHLIAPYRAQGHTEGECPVAEDVFNKYVTLPIHPRLTDEAIDLIRKGLKIDSENTALLFELGVIYDLLPHFISVYELFEDLINEKRS